MHVLQKVIMNMLGCVYNQTCNGVCELVSIANNVAWNSSGFDYDN